MISEDLEVGNRIFSETILDRIYVRLKYERWQEFSEGFKVPGIHTESGKTREKSCSNLLAYLAVLSRSLFPGF